MSEFKVLGVRIDSLERDLSELKNETSEFKAEVNKEFKELRKELKDTNGVLTESIVAMKENLIELKAISASQSARLNKQDEKLDKQDIKIDKLSGDIYELKTKNHVHNAASKPKADTDKVFLQRMLEANWRTLLWVLVAIVSFLFGQNVEIGQLFK